MPKFAYEALNESGSTVSGVLDAASVDAANTQLTTRGYIPIKVVAETKSAVSGGFMSELSDRLTPVKTPELILFTKQFRTLLRSGIPILTLLQVMENQTENPKLKKVVASMAQNIREGGTLYDAFKRHSNVFSNLYCSMIRAGESSGAVPEVLDRLTYLIEHEHKIKSDIRSALQYPMTVVFALGIAFFVLLTFVVPKFVAIFQNAGLKLPPPTLICLYLYQFIFHYWFVALALLVGLVVGLRIALKTDGGQLVKDQLILRLPIFGPLFIKSAMSRFASIFAILQASGVPILDALSILGGTIGHPAIALEFDRIRLRVEQGRGIAAPLASAKYFTPMVINMVAIGEEAGNLEDMLREVAVHYDDEVAFAVKGLTEALNPILMVGLAGVVGFFAMAIFLPMWDLTQIATQPH